MDGSAQLMIGFGGYAGFLWGAEAGLKLYDKVQHRIPASIGCKVDAEGAFEYAGALIGAATVMALPIALMFRQDRRTVARTTQK